MNNPIEIIAAIAVALYAFRIVSDAIRVKKILKQVTEIIGEMQAPRKRLRTEDKHIEIPIYIAKEAIAYADENEIKYELTHAAEFGATLKVESASDRTLLLLFVIPLIKQEPKRGYIADLDMTPETNG